MHVCMYVCMMCVCVQVSAELQRKKIELRQKTNEVRANIRRHNKMEKDREQMMQAKLEVCVMCVCVCV